MIPFLFCLPLCDICVEIGDFPGSDFFQEDFLIAFVDCLVVGLWKMDNHKLHSQSIWRASVGRKVSGRIPNRLVLSRTMSAKTDSISSAPTIRPGL